jgi:hypothetical protein
MRQFQFNSLSDQDNNIEEVLQYRRKKIARQQIAFATILFIILLLLGVYLFNKITYTELDGYVSIELNVKKSLDDVYVKDLYVRPGDFVVPGDTLYSYVYTKPLIDLTNNTNEPVILDRGRQLNQKYSDLIEEIKVLRAKIATLRKQIANEDHNISFGLSGNSHKWDLQRTLQVTKEELSAKMAQLPMLRSQISQLGRSIKASAYRHGRNFMINDVVTGKFGHMEAYLQYSIAKDSSIVTDIYVPEKTYIFAQDPVLEMQSINLERSEARVMVYVPANKVKDMTLGRHVEVEFSDDLILEGTVAMMGMHTEELPEHLRSNFMRSGRVLLALVELVPGQNIPYWAVTNRMPVKVRFTNLDLDADDPGRKKYHNIMMTTGSGLTKPSYKFLKERNDQMRKRNRHNF